MTLPTRPLGRTGRRASIIGLGGVTYNQLDETQAAKVVHRALDLGITYIDTAHGYTNSELRIGPVLRERREGLYIASKSTARDADTMRKHIEESLRRLQTDHVDCYQVHDLATEDQLAQVLAPGGAMEALEEYRANGVIDFIGVTGHRDPDLLCKALREYPFQSVLASTGAIHEAVRPFYRKVAKAAEERGAALLGMKVMGFGFLSHMAETAIAFVLSQERVASAVIGVDNAEHVEENVTFARAFCEAMSPSQQKAVLAEAARIYNQRKGEAWFLHPAG